MSVNGVDARQARAGTRRAAVRGREDVQCGLEMCVIGLVVVFGFFMLLLIHVFSVPIAFKKIFETSLGGPFEPGMTLSLDW
ncbi:MAG: hypothetical protein HS112_01770 [Zoogloeaceae bacterium]|nr:hypothetical protein [Zoogloeaceae bacterium]